MPPNPEHRPGRTGRRIAIGLYVLLTLYVIGAGVISVVPQIFWPAQAGGIAAVDPPAGCGPALHGLRSDLLDRAADRVRRLGETEASSSSDPLFAEWDQRYRALEARCGDLPSYPLLARLRYGVEEQLLRFEAEQASLAQRSLRAIESDGR